MKEKLLKSLPQPIRRWGWKTLVMPIRKVSDLRTSTKYRHIGPSGPLVKNVFDEISSIPGAFNLDDMSHFYCILKSQSIFGLSGNLLEIGAFFGRSTSMMCSVLEEGEVMHVCDAFTQATEDSYSAQPTEEVLMRNIRKATPEFSDSSIIIHNCLSNDLKLSEEDKFRFVHVDGGHSDEQAFADLELVAPSVLLNGIIAVDDYDHRHWPGVTSAVDRFLSLNKHFEVFADLNRHGALGRKVYLRKVALS